MTLTARHGGDHLHDKILFALLGLGLVIDVVAVLDGLGIMKFVADPFDPLEVQARALFGGRQARRRMLQDDPPR